MFVYEKHLQYPVKIKNTNPRLAAIIISQYGGPDGELAASLRYLSQRFSMPFPEQMALLTDIGREAPEMFLSGANTFLMLLQPCSSILGEANSNIHLCSLCR